MKHLKRIAAAALAVTALAALGGAGSASATTLEVKGVKAASGLTIRASLAAGNSTVWRDTFGFLLNTCIESNVHGTTSNSTGASVTGNLSAGEAGLTFKKCEREPVVVHAGGTFHITYTSGTNGTVTSSGTKVTVESPFGTVLCETGAGTHLGTLTGSAAGHATLAINAQFGCSGVSSRWGAVYTITTPTGLGVVA